MMQDDEIPCVTQIPLTYGDTGDDIEPNKMLMIHQAFVRQFGGFTPLGTIYGGVWFDEMERREVKEDQLRIEVWVPRSRIPVFKTLVGRIGYETRQKQMFVIIPEARVDRLDITGSDGGGLGS
jgi:hypothetical protein